MHPSGTARVLVRGTRSVAITGDIIWWDLTSEKEACSREKESIFSVPPVHGEEEGHDEIGNDDEHESMDGVSLDTNSDHI